MNKDNIIIRQLTKSDWAIFRAVRLHALATEPDKFSSNYAKENAYTDDIWQTQLSNPASAFFGLFDGDQLTGITGIIRKDLDAHANEAICIASYLLPEYRGKGLSKMFYQARLDWAVKEPGLQYVCVGHRASNIASYRANQAFGFKLVSKEMRTWPDGMEEDQHIYRLDLNTYESRPA